MDRPSISTLKSELQNLGLSTQTPGLTGDERFEELNGRLLDAQSKLNTRLSRPMVDKNRETDVNEGSKEEKASSKANGAKKETFVMPSLQDLSITEIRSRLTSLGESTNTPGLTGEERRDELMRRLVGAICGGDDNDMLEELVADKEDEPKEKSRGDEQEEDKPPKYVPPPPPRRPPGGPGRPKSPVQVQAKPVEESSEDEEELVVISQSEISEMKKSLKRLSNKRAMTIAARLSGSGQDPMLKEFEKVANQAEAEIARLNFQKQRSKTPAAEKASSVLLEGTKSMPLEKLLAKLENMRANAKEDVKQARQRVREECDADETYGVAAEQALSKQISDAVLTMGRTRRRVDELKMKSAKDKRKKKEREGQDRSKGMDMPRGGNKAMLESPLDSFDARMSKMEAENDRAMSGLDELLREMEEEEEEGGGHLAESVRLDQEGGESKGKGNGLGSGAEDGLGTQESPALAKTQARTDGLPGSPQNGGKLPKPKPKLSVSVGSPPGSRGGSRQGPRSPAALARASPKASPSSRTAARGGGSRGASHTSASPKSPKSPKSPQTRGGRGSPAGSPKSAAAAAAAGVSFRAGGPGPRPPEGAPPPEAVLKPGPGSGRILGGGTAGPAGGGSTAPERHPWELPEGLSGGGPTLSQLSGMALRSGKHFEEDDESVEAGANNAATPGMKGRLDTGEAVVASLIASRASTPGTSRRGGPGEGEGEGGEGGMQDEDDDEEMAALLRKYPKQVAKDEDGDEVSEPDLSADDEEAEAQRADDGAGASVGLSREVAKQQAAPRPRSVGFKTDPAPAGGDGGVERKSSRPGSGAVGFVDFEGPSDFVSPGTEEDGEAKGSRPATSSSSSSSSEEEEEEEKKPSPQKPPTRPKPKPALKGSFSSRIAALTTSSPDQDQDEDDSALRREEAMQAHAHAHAQAQAQAQDLGGNDDDMESLDEAAEDAKQIVVLRRHARVLDRLNDVQQTENVFARCLEIDPMDVKTLQGYAVFLHTRKGELARAEAFFLRAIHICLPDFLETIQAATSAGADSAEGKAWTGEPEGENAESTNKQSQSQSQSQSSASASASASANASSPSKPLDPQRRPAPPAGKPGAPKPNSLRVHTVSRLLLKFANFVNSARGDVGTATVVYRKALEVAPNDSACLASFAHFLVQEGDRKSYRQALQLFSRALKISPDNAAYALQYARLLKKTRNIGQADLMYQVAVQKAKGDKKLEPASICNYATFTCRQRKNPSLAYKMFVSGLERFPDHKGLVKNFELLVKSNPGIASPSAVQAAKDNRAHTPSSKSKVRRALAMANAGQLESGADYIDSPRTLEEYQASAAAVSKISPMVPGAAAGADKPSSPSLSGIDRARLHSPQVRSPAITDNAVSRQLGLAAENYGDFFAVDEDVEAGVYVDEEESEDEGSDGEEEEDSDDELYAAP